MPNSLLTGITGLVAHQRKLDTVAHNLANINTVAFKSHRVLFADLLYETVHPATNGSQVAAGGTNPNQIGSGVKTAQVSKNMNQGNLEETGNPFDFAISGEGFFILSDGLEKHYSRAGAFSLDESGNLVDPGTGLHVQRFGRIGEGDASNPAFQVPGDNRIHVPIGTNLGGIATSEISLAGNLLGNAIGPRAEVLTSVAGFLAGGSPATLSTSLNDLDANASNYVPGDIIHLSGTNADGTSFNTSLNVSGATTMADLINQLNSSMTDATATLNAQGNLVVTADNDGEAFLSVTLTDDDANTGFTDFGSHRLLLTTDGKLGESFESSLQIYDLQGGSHTVSYKAQKQDDNLWDMTFSIDPSEGVVIDGKLENLLFNEDGTFFTTGGLGIGDPNIEFKFNGISQTQKIGIDPSKLTQFSTEFDISTNQNGKAPGKLVAVRVNADGIIEGVSSNGDRVPVAQMAMALFKNPAGLTAIGSNYFDESLNSGEAQVAGPGAGGRGLLSGGQLESSNVDMALEFTQLIVAQRGFSANARTITVSDQMLEELTNIIR